MPHSLTERPRSDRFNYDYKNQNQLDIQRSIYSLDLHNRLETELLTSSVQLDALANISQKKVTIIDNKDTDKLKSQPQPDNNLISVLEDLLKTAKKAQDATDLNSQKQQFEAHMKQQTDTLHSQQVEFIRKKKSEWSIIKTEKEKIEQEWKKIEQKNQELEEKSKLITRKELSVYGMVNQFKQSLNNHIDKFHNSNNNQ